MPPWDALYAEPVDAGHPSRRALFTTDFDAYMAPVDDPDGNTVLITAGLIAWPRPLRRQPWMRRRGIARQVVSDASAGERRGGG